MNILFILRVQNNANKIYKTFTTSYHMEQIHIAWYVAHNSQVYLYYIQQYFVSRANF